VKPPSAAYLEKSRELLERAPALLAGNFAEEAGRAAYLAGFHAAQALIFERHDRVFKSHSGVQGEFARLVKTIRVLISTSAPFSAALTTSRLLQITSQAPDRKCHMRRRWRRSLLLAASSMRLRR
jgi:hypothetical protein